MIEFPGKIGYLYAEDNYIWVYDELSKGLYEINLDTMYIKIILDPIQIHKFKDIKIIGIVKRNKDIILIPQLTSDKWIVYETENRLIKYLTPIQPGYKIGEVQQNGDIVYLLPPSTNEPIFLLSLENMNCFKQIFNWYKRNKKIEKIYSCWGSSIDGTDVVFPIIKTNYICKVNKNGAEFLEVNITNPIVSVSVNLNNMWVLPTKGNYIYSVNMMGEIKNSIELSEYFGLSADKLVRIIALKSCVLLLPSEGNSIYIYIEFKKQIVKLDAEIRTGIEKLWEYIGNCPFWNYYIYKEKLYLLPIEHCNLEINLLTFKSIKNKLILNDPISENNYWKWALLLRKKKKMIYLKDYGDEAINNFIRLILNVEEKKEKQLRINGEIGKEIWKVL